MRKSSKPVNPSLQREIEHMLILVIADLKSKGEAEIFLKDFFTESELIIYVKRLAVSYWLKKNRSYKNIKENLKISSATIASVQTMLPKNGFQLALKKIAAEEWANQWAEKIKKFVSK